MQKTSLEADDPADRDPDPFVVGFMPGELDMLATVLVSFSCAMQVQTFRKVGGYSYASTMCIGNLRSGTAALSVYCREKRPEQLKQALYYFGIIFFLPLEPVAEEICP